MTAHPFQESPTFGEYCDWLKRQGGSVQPGRISLGDFTRLSYPKGRRDRRAILPIGNLDERLTPSKVNELDSRLGVTSPWNPDSEAGNEESSEGPSSS